MLMKTRLVARMETAAALATTGPPDVFRDLSATDRKHLAMGGLMNYGYREFMGVRQLGLYAFENGCDTCRAGRLLPSRYASYQSTLTLMNQNLFSAQGGTIRPSPLRADLYARDKRVKSLTGDARWRVAASAVAGQ